MNALNVPVPIPHSPLEGESGSRGRSPQANRWGVGLKEPMPCPAHSRLLRIQSLPFFPFRLGMKIISLRLPLLFPSFACPERSRRIGRGEGR